MALGRKPGLPVSSGGGGGASSVVFLVAASNATAGEIAAADYLCDGTADQTEINSAIGAATGYGGVVQLSTGLFSISAQITANVDGVVLRGQNAGYLGNDDAPTMTELRRTAAATQPIVLITEECAIENIHFSLASSQAGTTAMISCASNDSFRIENCLINGLTNGGTGQRGVSTTAGGLRIVGCHLDANGAAVYSLNAYDAQITDSYFFSSGSTEPCLWFEGNTGSRVDLNYQFNVRIQNCYTDGCARRAIQFTQIGQGYIEGCQIMYNSYAAIAITQCAGIIVSDNQIGGQGGFDEAMLIVDDSIYVTVADNRVDWCDRDGIVILNSDDCQVSGNAVIGAGQLTDDTYSGIKLDGNTNRCNVQNNMVRYEGANHTKYGIRVDDSTCDDNLVTNNDLKNSGDTASYSDAGTGTITTAANRT